LRPSKYPYGYCVCKRGSRKNGPHYFALGPPKKLPEKSWEGPDRETVREAVLDAEAHSKGLIS